MNSKLRKTLIPVLLLLPALLAADVVKEAFQKVETGLRHYRSSEFEDAESAFAEASKLAPESYVIVFDEACAARASGDIEQARSLFRKATQATSAGLSVKAHYNLGCLEADEARGKLGDDPAAAEGEIRTESISLLLASVGHYRDVLRFNPDHQDARHNLELIRLFIKHVQSQWAERDKQKARDEKNLLQFLKMIEERETGLRDVVRKISDEENSTSKRKFVRETSAAQDMLREEIEPLKQKITQEIQASQQQAAAATKGQPAAADDQSKQMEKLLLEFADKADEQMGNAVAELTAGNFDPAAAAQTESLKQLNQLYLVVAPYEEILQRSITEELALVGEEEQADAAGVSDEPPGNSEAIADAAVEEDTPADAQASSDDADVTLTDDEIDGVIEMQGRISDWTRMLTMKAESGLPEAKQQLESLEQSAGIAEGETTATEADDGPAQSAEPDDGGDDDAEEVELTEEQQAVKAQEEQMQQQLKQLQGLVKSMELAVELGPEAEQHSRDAVTAVGSKEFQDAEQEQREVLQLLKKIAEPLQNDQQDQDDQDQEQDQDENQDQQKDDDQQQQENEESKSGDQKDEKPEPKENEQPPEEKEADEKESKRQQAESVLSQARERERQRRELEKQLKALLRQGFKVEKDW